MLKNVPQTCDFLNLGRTTLWKLVKDGALPSVTIGKKRLFREADLQKFIADLPTSAPKQD